LGISIQAYGALSAVAILAADPVIIRRAIAAQIPEAEMRKACSAERSLRAGIGSSALAPTNSYFYLSGRA